MNKKKKIVICSIFFILGLISLIATFILIAYMKESNQNFYSIFSAAMFCLILFILTTLCGAFIFINLDDDLN